MKIKFTNLFNEVCSDILDDELRGMFDQLEPMVYSFLRIEISDPIWSSIRNQLVTPVKTNIASNFDEIDI